jgi:hypothetical protein
MAAGVWAFTWEILPALAWVAVGVAVLAWALPNHAQNARERLNWVISHLLYRLLMWQMGVRPSPTLGPRYLLINVSLRQTKYNAVQIPARKSRIPRLPTHHGLRSAPLTCQISSATTTRARKVNVCYAWKNWYDHKIELRKVSEVRGQHEFQAPNPLRAKSPQLKFAGSPNLSEAQFHASAANSNLPLSTTPSSSLPLAMLAVGEIVATKTRSCIVIDFPCLSLYANGLCV